MKYVLNTIAIVLLSSFLISCGNESQNSFTLNVELKGVKNNSLLYLKKRKDNKWVKVDSLSITDGKTRFSGSIDLPEMYYLSLDKSRSFIPVFIEKGTINLVAEIQNMQNPSIEGSEAHKLYDNFSSQLKTRRGLRVYFSKNGCVKGVVAAMQAAKSEVNNLGKWCEYAFKASLVYWLSRPLK